MVAATFYGRSLLGQESTIEDVWEKMSWRAKLYAQKLTGGVPDFSWNELLQMTRQQGGFGLGEMALHGMSLEGAVHNPHITQMTLLPAHAYFAKTVPCAMAARAPADMVPP